MTRVVTLAHYYTAPDIQRMADKVGDSLELSLFARDAEADIIVFAGVRFMAETARILNPEATVILPDAGSTCSLVTQTDVAALKALIGILPRQAKLEIVTPTDGLSDEQTQQE